MTRFHRPIRIALAVVLSLVATTSWAATFSFAIDDTLSLDPTLEPPVTGPDVLVTGSITTGALGTLSAAEIVDFAITLTVPGVAEETITSGGNTLFAINGDVDVEATQTELRITLGQDASSQVTFFDGDTSASYLLIGTPAVGSAIVTASLFAPSGAPVLGRGLDLGPLPAVQTYRRIVEPVAPIPLPPAAALLFGGLGVLTFVKRRRA